METQKHGVEGRRQWRKLHIGIDAQTMQLRAICVTSNNVSDAAVVPDLLAQVPGDERLSTLQVMVPTTRSPCMKL